MLVSVPPDTLEEVFSAIATVSISCKSLNMEELQLKILIHQLAHLELISPPQTLEIFEAVCPALMRIKLVNLEASFCTLASVKVDTNSEMEGNPYYFD